MTVIISGTEGVSDVDGSAGTPAIRGTDANTGIFFPAADTIAFAEGGAEVARFDSSGKFGVGTTSPGFLIHASQSSSSGSGGAYPAVVVRNTNTSTTSISEFRAQANNTTIDGSFAAILDSGDSFIRFGALTNHPVTFYTNSAERARITSGGSFVMGGTAAPTIAGVGAQHGAYGPAGSGSWAMGLQQDTTSAGGGRILGLRNVTDFNNASNEIIYYTGNTTERFSFVSNGGLRNYSANNVNLSDRREKTNFAPAKNYLDTICSIPVQTFNYIDQAEDDPGLTLGVVAQDVQEIAPELVMESNWGTQEEPKMRLAIYQTDLQYALMKSIQELKAINDAQASRIETLEAKVAALEAK